VEAVVTWKVRDVVSQRIELVVRVVNGGESVTQLSAEYGISRATAHHWLKRYRETKSFTALVDLARAPHRVRNRTPEPIVKRVLEIRGLERWGGRKIQEVLHREGIRIGARTVDRILNRAGCIGDEDRQQPALNRFERGQPNELWQMDFKGQYRSPRGDCYPLSIVDDHSRFAVGLYALNGTALEPVRDSLTDAFQRYGVSEQMLMDHGTPWWGAHSEHGLTQLSVWMIKQGIQLRYSGIGHPQTQGKVERFHRTLSESLRHHHMPDDPQQWQDRLDRFRHTYNEVRPHEALMMKVPSACYSNSCRRYCANPQLWQYPSVWSAIVVNSQGSVDYRGQRFFLSRALANEVIGVQKVDKTALVRFRHMYVREVDLETGESRPLFDVAGGKAVQTTATVEIK
jgi:transposase InsO family protein